MDLLIPLGGFVFVLGSFGAGPGVFAALGFAGMVWMWAMITAG